MADQLRSDRTSSEQVYLTLAEVAAHYRTTEGTVRYWRHLGRGPQGVKLGTRVLYPRAEVERFDAQLAAEAGTESAPIA